MLLITPKCTRPDTLCPYTTLFRSANGQDGNARQYVERRILPPLGVTIGSWRSGPDGAPLMPQGLVLAASEWAKIGEFVRGGGKLDGKPLVDELAFAELFKGSQANRA